MRRELHGGSSLSFALVIFMLLSLISVTMLQWSAPSAGASAAARIDDQADASLRSAAAVFGGAVNGNVNPVWKDGGQWEALINPDGTIQDELVGQAVGEADCAVLLEWENPPDIAIGNPVEARGAGENFILEVLRDMAAEHRASGSATVRQIVFPGQDEAEWPGWPPQISTVTLSLRMDTPGSYDITAVFSAPGATSAILSFRADTLEVTRGAEVSGGVADYLTRKATVIVWPSGGRTAQWFA